MLDDSTAFVGVEAQETPLLPWVLFPICSQLLVVGHQFEDSGVCGKPAPRRAALRFGRFSAKWIERACPDEPLSREPYRGSLMLNKMAAFFFRSARGEIVSPTQWVADWASRFDNKKFPEDVYQELIARGPELSDADFDVLGAWKDGAVRSTPNHGLRFGTCWCSFNGKWSPTAASCAYTVWRSLPGSRTLLAEYLRSEQFCEFLAYLAEQRYAKASGFGLSRATYVLHVFSRAKFPIYDANTQCGLHFLTQGRHLGQRIPKMKTKDPDWYINVFCRIVHDLQRDCDAKDLEAQRAIDQALFCYGKSQR